MGEGIEVGLDIFRSILDLDDLSRIWAGYGVPLDFDLELSGAVNRIDNSPPGRLCVYEEATQVDLRNEARKYCQDEIEPPEEKEGFNIRRYFKEIHDINRSLCQKVESDIAEVHAQDKSAREKIDYLKRSLDKALADLVTKRKELQEAIVKIGMAE
ncbi:hypothetical protein COCNU_06G019660 [Cocos nucifera]|uniref:Uncharacterized protein n=1 Tax=Cocos nucifera TaxID=13894 RepID=A0A8K0IE12_COCNU|nr:hypothetical protein COCNU_06G019660 [Cocos nucifera]